MNKFYVHILRRIFSFFSVLKTCIDYIKMHSECTILMQISQNFSGETSRTPTCGRGWPVPTLPLSALRASVKPSATLVTCAPPPPPGSAGSGSAPDAHRFTMLLFILKFYTIKPQSPPFYYAAIYIVCALTYKNISIVKRSVL